MPYPNIFGDGGAGFAVGQPNNLFGTSAADIGAQPLVVTPAASRGAAEGVRDTYATANPSWLASYDTKPGVGIFLYYLEGTDVVSVGQTRIASQWVDQVSTVGIQGRPGSGTDFSGIAANNIPAIGPGPDYVPYDSGIQVLPDGSVLAPRTFGVESGSVDFGDLLTLSETGGFLGITNNAVSANYTLVDFATPQNAPSSVPRIFALTEAENLFVAQPEFGSTIVSDNISFNYTTTLDARTNDVLIKLAAAVTNLRVKVTYVPTGVALKYWPDKASWLAGTGASLPAGDNSLSLGDTPMPLTAGTQINFNIRGTGLQMLGNALGVPYLAGMVQRGVFRNLAMYDTSLTDINAGHRVTVDKTNPRIPVVATPTNTGVILSASLTVTSSNRDQLEESTVLFDNATGNLDVGINIAAVPTGWAMWVGHRNALATTATFSVTISGGGTINGASSYSGAKNTVIRIVKTGGLTFDVVVCAGDDMSIKGDMYVGSDLTTTGSVTATGGLSMAGKLLPSAPVVSAFGDVPYFDVVNDTWRTGPAPIAGVSVAGTPSATGQVLRYDAGFGTWVIGQPLLATYPVTLITTLQDGDALRYDLPNQRWVNSRGVGSQFARRQSTAQTVASLTDTRVAFDTGDSFLGFNSGDVGFTYDGTTNIGRFTNTSGRRSLVTVAYQILWQTDTHGIRFAWIRINGITGNRVGYVGLSASGNTDVTVINGAANFALDNGQYFEVWCYHSSNTSLTIGGSAGGVDAGYGNRIQITRMNP